MYVPELSAILGKIGLSKEDFDQIREGSNGSITIPIGLFEFLMQITLAQGEFNEAGYLAANPDVASAHKAGQVKNP